MTETLCDSGAVKFKAGINASTTVTNNAVRLTQYINQAEGQIVAETGANWLDDYSGMNVDFKQVLESAASCWAAIDVIEADMSGFTTLGEATTMINTLLTKYDRAITVLKDSKKITALGSSYIQN